MFYGPQDIEIWRLIPPSGNWGDPSYSYHHTEFDVTCQPFSSSELVRNNQSFANVTGVIISDIEADIQNGDELVYVKNATYGRVHVAESWDSDIMPHKEIYVTDSQWDRSL